MVTQHIVERYKGQKAFHYLAEVVIRGIQYQKTRTVVRSYLGGKATSQAAAIYYQVVFAIFFGQAFIYILHVVEHLFFVALAGAFAKTPVVYQHHIIIVPVKIAGVLGPAFNAAGIAMKIKHQAFRLFAIEMQAVDSYTWVGVEVDLFKRNVILELEVGVELFRAEDKELLQEIHQHGDQHHSTKGIVNYRRQMV